MARAHRRAKHREVQHAEFLFGQVTAMVANTGFRNLFEELVNARDFMPSQHKGEAAQPVKPRRRSRKAIAEDVRRVMNQLFKPRQAEG
jgi:hypothetical protein